MLRVNQRRVVLHQPALLALGEFSVASSKYTKTSTQGREGSTAQPTHPERILQPVLGESGGLPERWRGAVLCVCILPGGKKGSERDVLNAHPASSPLSLQALERACLEAKH